MNGQKFRGESQLHVRLVEEVGLEQEGEERQEGSDRLEREQERTAMAVSAVGLVLVPLLMPLLLQVQVRAQVQVQVRA